MFGRTSDADSPANVILNRFSDLFGTNACGSVLLMSEVALFSVAFGATVER